VFDMTKPNVKPQPSSKNQSRRNPGRDYDIVVYGASGFTGRLVAEYLYQRGITGWAMGGRSLAKLAEVRDSLGLPADTPMLEADSDNEEALRSLCERTRLVLTTVGPYQLYGSKLVAACAATGTDYVDLCGEPAWMRAMIDAHAYEAQRTGARIVFSCGFDSIPFDLGVHCLQRHAQQQFGKPFPRVRGRVRSMQGTVSGGTAASLGASLKAAAANPSILGLLRSPFALTPGFDGPKQPSGLVPEYDHQAGAWAAPFIMAPINTKNVHRTNLLLGHAYGTDFVYDEMMLTKAGDVGKLMAEGMAAMAKSINPFGPGPVPKPGEGPSQAQRESGFYDIVFTGEMPDGQTGRVTVKGDRDPGYGSTCKMISESALTLLETPSDGGVWTPGGLMAESLQRRLEQHAGLSFTLES
jgi:short subunit dehydrogenase-like uncharacterized protein